MKTELKILGKTRDSNDDVFDLHHGKSRLHGCIHSKGVNIWAVHSYCHGDLKRMMNYLVEKTGKSNVLFTMVVNNNLMQVLKGFKPEKMYFKPLGEWMTCLRGIWKAEY